MGDKKYAFFSHRECEFFPCHQGIDEDQFNCLFCYCPLYLLKDQCGGHFTYLENGVKDCSQCTLPHRKDCYEYIVKKLQDNLFEKGITNQSMALS